MYDISRRKGKKGVCQAKGKNSVEKKKDRKCPPVVGRGGEGKRGKRRSSHVYTEGGKSG